MSHNSFGRLLTVTTWGESHGAAIGCVIDGCPAKIPLTEADIQPRLDRRRPGRNPQVSPRNEPDAVKIMSGTYAGKTTGAPISLLIENRNQHSADYAELAPIYRPGHADATYHNKYGIRDPRGGGRASARETAARVAAGAVAERLLAYFPDTASLRIQAALIKLGQVPAEAQVWNRQTIDANPFFCPAPDAVAAMEAALSAARERGDSLGGVVEARVDNVPPGLGEPLYDRLDARLAGYFMGINAVKGVEIGAGFAAAELTGSENNDAMRSPASGRIADAYQSNHAGGILGGISTGGEIVVRIAFKPTPSIGRIQETVDEQLANRELAIGGRHDPAVCIRAVPVVEAMLALALADFYLLYRASKH